MRRPLLAIAVPLLVLGASAAGAQELPRSVVDDPLGLGERLALIDHLRDELKVAVPEGATYEELVALYWRAHGKDPVAADAQRRDLVAQLRFRLKADHGIDAGAEEDPAKLGEMLRAAEEKATVRGVGEADGPRGRPEDPPNHRGIAAIATDLVGADGQAIPRQRLMKPKYLLVYITAGWCGPCREFTPKLVAFHRANGGGERIEVLMISRDRSGEEMAAYMSSASMPWPAVAYAHAAREKLAERFGGDGIPNLLLLGPDDEVIARSYEGGEYVGPNVPLARLAELLKGGKP